MQAVRFDQARAVITEKMAEVSAAPGTDPAYRPETPGDEVDLR